MKLRAIGEKLWREADMIGAQIAEKLKKADALMDERRKLLLDEAGKIRQQAAERMAKAAALRKEADACIQKAEKLEEMAREEL